MATTRPSSPTMPSSGSASRTRRRGCSCSDRRRRMAGRSSRSRASRRPSTPSPFATPVNYDDYRASDGKPAWLGREPRHLARRGGPLYDLKQHDTFVRAYLATLLSVDESVGRDLRGAARVRATRRHRHRLHERQRLRARRARPRGQADDVRGEHPGAAAGALPTRWSKPARWCRAW